MGTLMTICPLSGRNIEIGIETDKHTLAAAWRFSAQITCVSCGHQHTISDADVWVCETIGGHPRYSPEV